MQKSAPLELLADASGSVTFGWADDRVYYARFSRSLSARLGETFAARLAAAVEGVTSLSYFADARDLESYDLAARSAILRVLGRQRSKIEHLEVLWWDGTEPREAVRATFGESLHVTRNAAEFEARLVAYAPQARSMLVAKPEPPYRSRWPLRR
ncbi:MAG: hypothetical protein K0R38_5988 [Polyangiaceae bacterium]|jgi:hypothetical protein|nr:hypothetical protein [Polyangiaceae bacterium]